MPLKSRRRRFAGAKTGSTIMSSWFTLKPADFANDILSASKSLWWLIRKAVKLVTVSLPLERLDALIVNVVLIVTCPSC